MKMKINKQGINFIKQMEGFYPTLYKDSADFATIGYGHKVHDYELQKFKDITLTKDEATNLLSKDVVTAEDYINFLCNQQAILKQNQFNALCSLAFNVGTFGNHLVNAIKQHNISQIATLILEYNHINGVVSKGLSNRRYQEQQLFLSEG